MNGNANQITFTIEVVENIWVRFLNTIGGFTIFENGGFIITGLTVLYTLLIILGITITIYIMRFRNGRRITG